MRNGFASILIVAAICTTSGAASAQKGLSTGANLDGMDNARRIEENKLRALDKPRKAGLEALQAQDYTLAETSFTELLSHDPTTSDANYLMGLAKIGLKKWAEAKQYLDVAVTKEPKRAEPKARLAIADLMVNDMPSATLQRAELASLSNQCANSCPEAKLIASNLAMVDKVLAAAQPKTATPATPPPPPNALMPSAPPQSN